MNHKCPTCQSTEIVNEGTLGWTQHLRCTACRQSFTVELPAKDPKQKARWLRAARKEKAHIQKYGYGT